jgi:glycerol-3-phosphate dehydrogenase (NAD(P)+)
MLPTVPPSPPLPQSVAVIGAGSWGTTVATIVSGHAATVLWGRNPEVVAAVSERHENPEYLPGIRLPDELRATTDLAEACATADVVIMAVPSHGFRAVLEAAAPFVAADVPVVSLTKGLERETMLRMTEVVLEVLPDHDPDQGPCSPVRTRDRGRRGSTAAPVIAPRRADRSDSSPL